MSAEVVAEIDWKRRATPPGAWEEVARRLLAEPAGTRIHLWWYGERTAPNGPWMRDKCRRLGVPNIEITHGVEAGAKVTFVSVPVA